MVERQERHPAHKNICYLSTEQVEELRHELTDPDLLKNN